jgi:hypothetical protein
MHNILMFNNGRSRLEVAAQALDNNNAIIDHAVMNNGKTVLVKFFDRVAWGSATVAGEAEQQALNDARSIFRRIGYPYCM